MSWLLLFLLALPGALFPVPSQSGEEPPVIRHHVSLAERQAQRVHVTSTFEGVAGESFDVALPVWTPGSYLVREFARHVLEFDARTPDGRVLPAEKVSKNTWRITHGGAPVVTVDTVIYCNERSVRTNHVDADHAFLSPAATFFFLRGHMDRETRVSFAVPEGWGVYTGLPRQGDDWVAADYDTLVDCPFELGPHDVLSFTYEDVPFRIVLGGAVTVDRQQLTDDVRAIVAEVTSVFGFLPFDDYTFIINVVDSGGGGLEHKNSSVNMVSRWKLKDTKSYRGLLSLLAHEYFHAWNVKRFRPASLGPFDYDRENYTRDLWVAEGITSYIDDRSVVRAGFADKVTDYLGERAKAFRSLARTPGASRMSLSRSSYDAWIKLYRPDENQANSAISYYSKGALVAMMLDLRIRRLTDGERTLADALRLGWERYTAQGSGYPEQAMHELASETAGADLSTFFTDYVDGTAPLDPNPDLAFVGLELKVEPKKGDRQLEEDEDGFPLSPDLGVRTDTRDGLCRVKTVLEGGAAFRAGLNVDDLILAIDGMRVSSSTLQDRLDRAGVAPLELTYFRGQSMRTVTLTPDVERLDSWKIAPLEDATEEQQRQFQRWLDWDFPGTKGDEDNEDEDGDA